jgi:glycosyltransferase involved in cell wall biosynthesis
MRITIVQGAFMPVPPILGTSVEKIWFALGKEFVRRGHQVTHISREHVELKREEYVEGVHHIRIPGFDVPSSLVRLKWRDLRYSRRAVRMLPEADILVTNTFWLPVLAPTAARGKIYVHIARYPRGQMKFYRKAARLQTVSTVIRNAICKQAPALTPKVKVIPNFVSRSGPPAADENREKCFLYVGRLHPEKGVHLLIEAFRQLLCAGLKDWKLRLVGPWEVAHGGGGMSYFQSLRTKTEGIENFVEWVGPVFDPERLSAYYQQSSVFVYPSLAGKREASPLAPLEAMAGGCPTVVSSLECFRDYLRPGRNGWTFDENSRDKTAELAATLRSVMSDSGMLRRVREGAVQTAQHYTLSNVADLYLNDFQELLCERFV